ncbi:glycerol acyltransferase [Mucilaginibacter hurinus]|uniref:Glycerol acyltransferase n=1 Tax=Mucilaginibacter hurinus TaxID=2201324 RepID=A0A367GPM2_9SPHI|nr:lysophospholipid acyltransferase family protein [Mucilaginibacter hurinus]RCH55028.1 glycerol acyltransferase [Mucilaginibacter hurinus]
MITTKSNKLIHWFFHRYINYIVNKNFHGVKYNTVQVDLTRSVLLIANHFSWWDGFILYHLNTLLFKKRFHIMVLEETVRKVSFIKYMGAFSVAKNSRDILTSINYAAGILNNPANLLVIFPQGKLHSNFVDDINFEKGAFKIYEQVKEKPQLIFAASFIEHLQHKLPTINVYLKSAANVADGGELAAVYQHHYSMSKQQQTKKVI